MPRSRWQTLRLLLVCAFLAFGSTPPRGALGWFESVTQVAHATSSLVSLESRKPAAEVAPQAVRARAPRAVIARVVPRAEGFAAPARVHVARPNDRQLAPVSRLYLVNSALLC